MLVVKLLFITVISKGNLLPPSPQSFKYGTVNHNLVGYFTIYQAIPLKVANKYHFQIILGSLGFITAILYFNREKGFYLSQVIGLYLLHVE